MQLYKIYHRLFPGWVPAEHSTGRQLEGKVKYNLGNVEYQHALQTLQRPQEALPHLRSAMTYYRDSLDVDPQQQDARYNQSAAAAPGESQSIPGR